MLRASTLVGLVAKDSVLGWPFPAFSPFQAGRKQRVDGLRPQTEGGSDEE